MAASLAASPVTAEDREAFQHAKEIYTVASEGVYSFAYDSLTESLFVTYPGQKTYCYDSVPEHVWTAFQAAESKGRFVNKSVKPHYVCRGPL